VSLPILCLRLHLFELHDLTNNVLFYAIRRAFFGNKASASVISCIISSLSHDLIQNVQRNQSSELQRQSNLLPSFLLHPSSTNNQLTNHAPA
jgi:hypothetical protein